MRCTVIVDYNTRIRVKRYFSLLPRSACVQPRIEHQSSAKNWEKTLTRTRNVIPSGSAEAAFC
jgi:hypothetical protein